MANVTRAAALVTALTALSTVLGLGRDVVIAGVFGATAALDAYFVAQGLMNVVLGLVAGAMARAAVPVAAREAAAEGAQCASHRSIDVALSVTLVVLGLATLLMWLGAGAVVTALAPGFDGAQAELARDLTRVVLLATVLIAGTNLLAALAQAHGRFGWAGVQGVPFNLVMIVAAAGFGPRYGVTALAGGFVVGSAVRLLLQLVPLRAIGARLRPSFTLSDPGFREIARLVPALLVGSAVGNVNTLVDRAVGSTLADGTISALGYAWRMVSLGETLLVASLLTALYPALGAASADLPRLQGLVSRGLAVTAVVLTPVSAVLVCAAHPAVTVLFGRGSFDADDAAMTATAVLWYAPALLALGWREVVTRASYAVGDSSGPVVVAIGAMVINVVGDLTLGRIYGIAGLAASTSLSLLVAAAANTWLLGRRHRVVGVASTGPLLARALLLGTLATLVGLATGRAVGVGSADDVTTALGHGTLIGAVVLVVYALGLIAVRAPEGRAFWGSVRQLLSRS
ncbi:MAG: murein biosynthesis integral membrane protein MurJ [Actinomycetota bacterium]|nr:murein biosynthesis integral membrane protein MurJ [Actinomycetota bacterium]